MSGKFRPLGPWSATGWLMALASALPIALVGWSDPGSVGATQVGHLVESAGAPQGPDEVPVEGQPIEVPAETAGDGSAQGEPQSPKGDPGSTEAPRAQGEQGSQGEQGEQGEPAGPQTPSEPGVRTDPENPAGSQEPEGERAQGGSNTPVESGSGAGADAEAVPTTGGAEAPALDPKEAPTRPAETETDRPTATVQPLVGTRGPGGAGTGGTGAAGATGATGATGALGTGAAGSSGSLPVFAPRYRSLTDANSLLAALSQSRPEAAHSFELGRTGDGRSVNGLEFGAVGAPPLHERPTVFLLGGLDGRSLAGAEAVLAATHRLLSDVEALPPGVTFVAVPWVGAEGLSWAQNPGQANPALDGRNSRPVDDDRDGAVDEDGPDDLDGDGLILDMLIEDPSGPWARAGDGRFLVPAAPGEGVRFVWTREGADDDGDGRFNEDPVGGVVLDRNFPVNRIGAWADPRCGAVSMSEPLTRAVADLVLSRRAAVVMLFQGHHGSIAVPGGLPPELGGNVSIEADAPLFERVTEAFLAATGRDQSGVLTLCSARGEPTPGAALDWMHAVAGALAIEVAPWGPRVEERDGMLLEGRARDAAFPQDHGGPAPRTLEDRALLGRTESAWASWLDNTRGGLGFVDWQPVELDGGRKGWVGGWEPRTILNPPEDTLPTSLEGLSDFVVELSGSLPSIEIEITRIERDGELLRLGARVQNTGRLPTGLARDGNGVRLELQLPSGAHLVAGATQVELPRLYGGELSREASWVLVSPPDATLTLEASTDWATSVVREVRR